MSERLRRTRNAAVSLLLVVVLAAGCASDGFPEAYDDQIDPDTGLSNVEANWLEGCEVGFGEELAESANEVCACSYQEIRATIPFEEFVEANDRLKSDPESLATAAVNPGSTEAALVEIVKDCIASG